MSATHAVPISERRLEAATADADQGDSAASRQLFASLYDELHSMARREVRRLGSAAALGVTTLLHEAYLNLDERRGVSFPDRNRFLAYASRVMRGLVIDHARQRGAVKRGGGLEISSLPEEVPQPCSDSDELQRLNDAIEELAAIEPRLAQVVDLKYFGGFSFTDIAAMWQVSDRTVQRDWEKARLFLHRALSPPAAG